MGTFTEYRFTASGGLPSTSFFGISTRIDIRDMNGMKDQLAGRMLKTSQNGEFTIITWRYSSYNLL